MGEEAEGGEHVTRHVIVRRQVTTEYAVPVTAYDGMSLIEIEAWEKDFDNVDPDALLDNISAWETKVWFEERPDEGR